jgi:hypothetical protein
MASALRSVAADAHGNAEPERMAADTALRQPAHCAPPFNVLEGILIESIGDGDVLFSPLPPVEGVTLLSLSVRLGLNVIFGSCFHFSASSLRVDT